MFSALEAGLWNSRSVEQAQQLSNCFSYVLFIFFLTATRGHCHVRLICVSGLALLPCSYQVPAYQAYSSRADSEQVRCSPWPGFESGLIYSAWSITGAIAQEPGKSPSAPQTSRLFSDIAFAIHHLLCLSDFLSNASGHRCAYSISFTCTYIYYSWLTTKRTRHDWMAILLCIACADGNSDCLIPIDIVYFQFQVRVPRFPSPISTPIELPLLHGESLMPNQPADPDNLDHFPTAPTRVYEAENFPRALLSCCPYA